MEFHVKFQKYTKLIKNILEKESLTVVNLEEIVEIGGATFPGIDVGKNETFSKFFEAGIVLPFIGQKLTEKKEYTVVGVDGTSASQVIKN